jgi:polysaccharide pyruvyl transferase WcaK-like protein
VGRDPAFDYLESRREVLTRLPDVDRRWLEHLLRDTEGRTTIGLNLRPIKPVYTVGATAENRADYTRFVESRFETRLVESMRRLHKAFPNPPSFIFFPMNAIQFGMCDLRSAYRLQRQLRGEVDFRVWEGDASIDGIVALLRRLDVVITMRFHATIYALAQRRRVVGIDYRIGKRDKVAALLDDAGLADSYRRVDEMTANWLFDQCVDPERRHVVAGMANPAIVPLTRRS